MCMYRLICKLFCGSFYHIMQKISFNDIVLNNNWALNLYILDLYFIAYKYIHRCDILDALTHWGRVTHICVGNLTIIVSDNGLSPGRHQAIIWTNAEVLLICPKGTNFILVEIQTFSLKEKIHVKMSSGKRRPFCLGLNVLASTALLVVDIIYHTLM